MGQVHSGHRWRELVRVLCPSGSFCEVDICVAPSREIVFGLRPRHPLGPSLDHVIEVWQGGAEYDPANLVPAHLGCNVRKSNRLRAAARAGTPTPRPSRTRAVATPNRPKRTATALADSTFPQFSDGF